MLPDKLDMQIVTPDRRVIAETVESVILPGREGYFGVLPGHAPLLTSLGVGEISYRVGGEPHHVAVAGGFVEVLGHRVSVLADTAERAEEIDLERAQRAKAAGEKAMAELSGRDFDVASARVRRAVTRIQVYGRLVRS